jgi:hypothetical protein
MKLASMLGRIVHGGTIYLQNGSINICTLICIHQYRYITGFNTDPRIRIYEN